MRKIKASGRWLHSRKHDDTQIPRQNIAKVRPRSGQSSPHLLYMCKQRPPASPTAHIRPPDLCVAKKLIYIEMNLYRLRLRPSFSLCRYDQFALAYFTSWYTVPARKSRVCLCLPKNEGFFARDEFVSRGMAGRRQISPLLLFWWKLLFVNRREILFKTCQEICILTCWCRNITDRAHDRENTFLRPRGNFGVSDIRVICISSDAMIILIRTTYLGYICVHFFLRLPRDFQVLIHHVYVSLISTKYFMKFSRISPSTSDLINSNE